MKKILSRMPSLLALFCLLFIVGAKAQFLQYSHMIEKLVYFKENKFKAFYGGPIDREGQGVRWMLPIVFDDDMYKARAVYEVAFVNCDIFSAQGAEVLFIDVSDINIKFKNTCCPDYLVFRFLLAGEYKNDKYIVVRRADVANVCYPDIFIASSTNQEHYFDKKAISNFLCQTFQAAPTYQDFYHNESSNEVIQHEDAYEVVYMPMFFKVQCKEYVELFAITKRILKDDAWKLYYVITKADTSLESRNLNEPVVLRLDSGCVSGQIYDDSACDCLDQLHSALQELSEDPSPGVIIHIPAHDGRGFGTAPKAETEIYKRGGRGRLHTTQPLDTVAAAKLLYGTNTYELRTFDGAARILKSMKIDKVVLLTDNIEKVRALERYGIEVERRKTNSLKASCIEHLEAKRRSDLYFSE